MSTEPTVALETITPEKAAAYLAANDHNRALAPSRVTQYADAMARGEWELNGETLKWNGDTLLDGQHRLAAVAKCGTPQRFLVIRGLPLSAQETVDTGRARRFADVLKIRGEKYSNNLAAATRIVYAFERSGIPVIGLLSVQPTHQELAATLERHPRIRESINAGGNIGQLLALSRSMVMGLHYLFSNVDQEDADTFFMRLSDGVDLKEGDPVFSLRDRLIRDMTDHKKLNPTVLTAFTIRAFNAWRAGEKMTKFQWKPGGAKPERFPQIEDCGIPRIG